MRKYHEWKEQAYRPEQGRAEQRSSSQRTTPPREQPEPTVLPDPKEYLPLFGERNRIVAAILAFLLGGIGVHRFYLGDRRTGLIYLLFFWTYIPTFISFVEAIFFLLMDNREFARRYLSVGSPLHMHRRRAARPFAGHGPRGRRGHRL
jgi:TM2 domain-containing membrane protein YozV